MNYHRHPPPPPTDLQLDHIELDRDPTTGQILRVVETWRPANPKAPPIFTLPFTGERETR